MASCLGDWKQVKDMRFDNHLTRGQKERVFIPSQKQSQKLSMKVKSNAPCNLEMFIQQALILTLNSNMSLTKLTHNVFIVEK